MLFVCLGNICRSPTAEAVLRGRLREHRLDDRVTVDSAGTHGYHIGRGPDARAIEAARRRGYSLEGQTARQVTPEDLERFDYILCMDQSNLENLRRLGSGRSVEVRLFLDYTDSEISEVPDPYYGGDKGFEQVLDLVEDACEGLIRELRQRL